MLIAEALTKTLSRVDPDGQTDYENNWINFKDKWSIAITKWEQQTQRLAGIECPACRHCSKAWVPLTAWAG